MCVCAQVYVCMCVEVEEQEVGEGRREKEEEEEKNRKHRKLAREKATMTIGCMHTDLWPLFIDWLAVAIDDASIICHKLPFTRFIHYGSH